MIISLQHTEGVKYFVAFDDIEYAVNYHFLAMQAVCLYVFYTVFNELEESYIMCCALHFHFAVALLSLPQWSNA